MYCLAYYYYYYYYYYYIILHNPSERTMTLVHSASNINGGKGGRCLGLATLQHLIVDCFEIWELHTPGTLRACPK
jgi:hypothetical protein